MKSNIQNLSLIVMCALTIIGCGKPDCVNSNSIFNEYRSEQIEYKEEVLKVVESNDDKIEFWLNRYVKNEEGEFIDVQISGDKICANALILVKDWTKMEGIQKTEGRAFSGAKLVRLKFILVKDSMNSVFLYKDVEKIMD